MRVRRHVRATMSWLIYTALVGVVGLLAVGVVKSVPAASGQAAAAWPLASADPGDANGQSLVVLHSSTPSVGIVEIIRAPGGTTRLPVPGSVATAPTSSTSGSTSSPGAPPSSPVSTPVSGPAPTQTPTPTPTSTSADGTQSKTFSLKGGSSIHATCNGSSLSTSVSLASGWQIDESEKSGSSLHLHIRATVGDGEAEVVVSCQNGSPVAV